jgi:NAD(P)-dependent dehydrogenase (short-subunit alcohol dehydrogenase family)
MPGNIIDMTGKKVLITGGSRGLGRAMALGFAEAGADVAIASRKLSGCEETAREVEAYGRRAFACACHVGSWSQCDALVEAVYSEFGTLDVLINNAGMSPLYESVASIPEALWDKVVDVNLKGPFRLGALIGERMAAGDGGAIINVSSTSSIRPRKDVVPYAAAKAGVNALTEALADAYGPKVRVNCIMPGPFLTDISKAWDLADFADRAREGLVLQRGGEPHEIVGAALYLASDHASFTTGAILRIDGGLK